MYINQLLNTGYGSNHAGVCLSFDATWNHLKNMVQQFHFLARAKQGHWIWIYDNFNINLTVRHEPMSEKVSLVIN